MDILYTILLVVLALVAAPFVAFAVGAIIAGLVCGLLLFFVVILMGAEPSFGSFLVCFFMSAGLFVSMSLAQASPKEKETEVSK